MELESYCRVDGSTCAMGSLDFLLVEIVKPDPLNPHMLFERQKQLNAARGPKMTFLCGACGQCKEILGRRKIDRIWKCKGCVHAE
jgi:hypothetical protein